MTLLVPSTTRSLISQQPDVEPPAVAPGDVPPGFRLQASVRRGNGSNVPATWSRYSSVDQAREAARTALHDERVVRMTVVTDTVPPEFVEWVNR